MMCDNVFLDLIFLYGLYRILIIVFGLDDTK